MDNSESNQIVVTTPTSEIPFSKLPKKLFDICLPVYRVPACYEIYIDDSGWSAVKKFGGPPELPNEEPYTNFQKFKAMTIEEIAEFLSGSVDCAVCKAKFHSEENERPCTSGKDCVDFWLCWLQQEAEYQRIATTSYRENPMMLVTDRCGDAYCPRCGTMLTGYHKSTHSLDDIPCKYCRDCGQRLIWDIDWSVE